MPSKLWTSDKKQMVQASLFPMVCPMRPPLHRANVVCSLLFPSYLFWNGTSIFISHLLRNLDKAIASLLLGPHIVRNYTFNLPPHSHTAACLLCGDRQGQLKIQWILEDRLWLLWLLCIIDRMWGSFLTTE